MPREVNCKSIMLLNEERMCFRLPGSLRFIAGAKTEALILLAQSLLGLLGVMEEYLIWCVRSRNLIRKMP